MRKRLGLVNYECCEWFFRSACRFKNDKGAGKQKTKRRNKEEKKKSEYHMFNKAKP
jgi:hypothetical protein